MLLAVSLGVLWTGLSMTVSAYKNWSFQALMLGRWGVPEGAHLNRAGQDLLGPATPDTTSPDGTPQKGAGGPSGPLEPVAPLNPPPGTRGVV